LAVERRLSAILAVDVVGYSRLMEADEAATFERLRAHRKELFEPEIARHHGRIFKLMGDGLLAEFGSVVDAVECAVLLQREMAEHNNGLADDRRIDVRMGIHVGDVIVEGEDRHGDAVIIASRLQQLAESGGICVSGAVADHVRHKVALRFEPRGEERLKNIAEPVPVYRVALDLARAGRRHRGVPIIGKWPAAAALATIAAVILGFAVWPRDEQPPPAPTLAASGDQSPTSATAPSEQTAMAPRSAPDAPLPPPDQGIPVIIVLPFQDLTGDQAPSELGKGIAEAFITDLATFPDFEVVSSTSSFAYAGKPVPEIVKATGALFVIEGSLRRSGGKAAVTMQLIRGDTDRHLKIAQIEEPMTDPVLMQSVVANRLRDELGGMTGILRQEYNRIALARPVADRTEYDYYVLGHIHSLCGNVEAAGDVWKQGLVAFPKSALLHYKLMIYHLDAQDAVGPAGELWEKAEKLERRSRLDEWYRHWLAAWLHGYRGERKLAVVEARATIAMAPYDAISHSGLTWVMREAGEDDEALEWAKFAVTHDPNMHEFYFNTLVRSYRAAGKWSEGVTFGETQLAKDPVHAKWWYDFLGSAYGATGQQDKAAEAFKKSRASPDPPESCPAG
jgi:class 3 adenylate cyclase/TolB-like protein